MRTLMRNISKPHPKKPNDSKLHQTAATTLRDTLCNDGTNLLASIASGEGFFGDEARPAQESLEAATPHKAYMLVFSFTQVTKASFGHGVAGSWQYFTKHVRVSSDVAGSPANPGHSHLG